MYMLFDAGQDRTCRFFNYLVDYIHKFDSRTAPLIKKAQDDVSIFNYLVDFVQNLENLSLSVIEHVIG